MTNTILSIPVDSTEIFFNVTHILFDFSSDDDDEELSMKEKSDVTNTAMNTLWSIDNTDGEITDIDELERSLCNLISDETGWLIEGFDYEITDGIS